MYCFEIFFPLIQTPSTNYMALNSHIDSVLKSSSTVTNRLSQEVFLKMLSRVELTENIVIQHVPLHSRKKYSPHIL